MTLCETDLRLGPPRPRPGLERRHALPHRPSRRLDRDHHPREGHPAAPQHDIPEGFMTTPLDGNRPPPRATGVRRRRQRHTNDGIARVIKQATRVAGWALFRANLTACDQKLRTPRS